MQKSLNVDVVTIFPPMIAALTDYGISRRALTAGIWQLRTWNPRDYTCDNHRMVDDRPYGGGSGMIMQAEPLLAAIAAAREHQTMQGNRHAPVIYMSPQGKTLDDSRVREIAQKYSGFIILCGRYAGIDERIINSVVDEEISVGDYVVSGGELPAMLLIDAVLRFISGVLGNQDSANNDSFASGLLGYPQYTRPEQINGMAVPTILLSGRHADIDKWRLQQSLWCTYQKRPELLEKRQLSCLEIDLLEEIKRLKNV